MSDEKEQKRISRREFVKGAAIGAAAVAGAGVLSGCGPEATPCPTAIPCPPVPTAVPCPTCAPTGVPDKWDEEADVVIVGYGSAGLAAAINAHKAGAKVLLLEKMPEGQEGGATRICGGLIGIGKILGPGMVDVELLRADAAYTIDEEYARAWGNGIREATTWFDGLGLRTTGTHDTMSTVNPAGKRGGSQVMWERFREEVTKLGISVRYETPGKALVQDPGTKEILGVIAESGGKTIAIKAKRAVVLTNGSYGHNPEMLSYYDFPGVYLTSCTSPGNTGDGHRMGMKVGAQLRNMGPMGIEWLGYAFKAPSQVYDAAIDLSLSLQGSSYIFVDKSGKRFSNEKTSIVHNKTPLNVLSFDGNWYLPPTVNDYPHLPFYIVLDKKQMDAGPLSSVSTLLWGWSQVEELYAWSADNRAEVTKGWIVEADTIEGLAAKMTGTTWHGQKVTVDPAGLKDTVTKFNEFCAAGKDLEFGRTDQELMPIDTPPYYAAELCLNVVYSIGGLNHNAKSQTLDVDGNPIPRLYSAGDTGQVGIMKPDGFIGALCFGFIAGENAAAEKPWG